MSATAAAPPYTVDGCEPAAFSNRPAPKTAMPYPTSEIQIRPPATEAAIPVDSNCAKLITSGRSAQHPSPATVTVAQKTVSASDARATLALSCALA